jgi:hypothetical protein
MVAAATMKVAQISKPGGDFEIVERECLHRVQAWHRMESS